MSNSEDIVLNVAQANIKFQQGQRLFEAGRYREAVQVLNQACALVENRSKSQGEMSIWLVSAYDAAGQRTESLSLCRKLCQSPYIDVRRQAKRLLSILEAPKLSVHDDWVTKIPSLDEVNERGKITGVSRSAPKVKAPKPKKFIEEQEIDLSQVTTQDRGLVGVAIVLVLILLGTLFWMA